MEIFNQHEYLLALYGVLLWHLEQYFHYKGTFKEYISKSFKTIGSSLIWVGIALVFDDELLDQYNDWANENYMDIPKVGYVMIGFFIDVIRSRFIK